MQGANFVVLTGHLNDYPLADLISILRRQRKTGRLLIEYSIDPCSLYFMEGNLVDAQLNNLSGLQAIVLALAQPNASFNFNPLIQPPRRSISDSSEKVVLELLGCWEEKTINAQASAGNGGALSTVAPPLEATPLPAEEMLLPAKEVLALPASPMEREGRGRNRRVLIASAAISLLVSLITVVVLTRWIVKRDISEALSEVAKKEQAGVENRGARGANAQTIKVTVQVDKGRVLSAFVEDKREGMEAYEARALRVARARRYPSTVTGQDRMLVKINSPD